MRLFLCCCAVVPVLALTLTGCGGTKVTRTSSDTTVDLSGKWNDTDSRLVAEEMIADSLTFPWASQFTQKTGKNPTVRLDKVTVRTDGDIIATDIFLNDIRRAFVRSGKVDVVSSSSEAAVTRAELAEQDKHASEDTRKEAFQETGADFMLHGAINVQNDQEGRDQVRFYSVDLFLTEVQSRKQVWIGNKKIKKVVNQSSYK